MVIRPRVPRPFRFNGSGRRIGLSALRSSVCWLPYLVAEGCLSLPSTRETSRGFFLERIRSLRYLRSVAQREGPFDARSRERIPGKSVRIVAYSEVNDLLTYELVPYFEHLYYTCCYGLDESTTGCVETTDKEYKMRGESFHKDEAARCALTRSLGVEAVDVRLRFAGDKIPLNYALKDPGRGHSGHLTNESALSVLLCRRE